MKKMKKFLSLSVAAVLALSMTACGSKAGDTQNADATEKSSSNAKYTVGICQLVQHEALDAATKESIFISISVALPDLYVELIPLSAFEALLNTVTKTSIAAAGTA